MIKTSKNQKKIQVFIGNIYETYETKILYLYYLKCYILFLVQTNDKKQFLQIK